MLDMNGRLMVAWIQEAEGFALVSHDSTSKFYKALTLPLSTMSLCRSFDDRTNTLIACIKPVQDSRILQERMKLTQTNLRMEI